MGFLNNNLVKIFSLYFLSILIRYYLPEFLGDIYFLALLIIFYNSKDNSFWIAFILMLTQSPGYLFFDGSPNYSLPTIWLTSTVELHYNNLFIAVALVKSINMKIPRPKLFYRKEIKYLAVYLVLLMIFTTIYELKITRLFGQILLTMPVLSFYFIPRLINSEKQFAKSFSTLFAFTIVLFFAQLGDLYGLRPLAAYIGETHFGVTAAGNVIDESVVKIFIEKNARAGIYGVLISLLSFIVALYYLTSNNRYFSKHYLLTIVVVTTLSFIMSGTRGWIIAYLFMIFAFGLLIINKPTLLYKMIFIPSIIVLIVFFSSEKTRTMVDSGIERLETISLLFKGDITAGGTLGRLDVRGPRVMQMVYKSPFYGWGFTNVYRNYQDSHVGHQTMLLNGGVIGYILFMFFFIQYNYKMFSLYKSCSYNNLNRKGILIFMVGFGGIFIIHSSTAIMFGYGLGFAKTLILSLVFTFSDNRYQNLKKNNQIIKYDTFIKAHNHPPTAIKI